MIPFSPVWLGGTWKVSITDAGLLSALSLTQYCCRDVRSAHTIAVWCLLVSCFHLRWGKANLFFLTLWIIIRICYRCRTPKQARLLFVESWRFGDARFTWTSDLGSLVTAIKMWSLLWIGVCYGHRENMTELVPTLPKLASCGCMCLTVCSRVYDEAPHLSLCLCTCICAPHFTSLQICTPQKTHGDSNSFHWTDHCQSASINSSRWDTKEMQASWQV